MASPSFSWRIFVQSLSPRLTTTPNPGRSLQVCLVLSPGVRGCTELHGFLARPSPALSLCKNSRCRRYGRRGSGCCGRASWRGRNPPLVAKVSSWNRRRTPEGPLLAREVAAPESPRLPCSSKGSRVPTPDSLPLLPACRARRKLGKRFPLGCPASCHLHSEGGVGLKILRTRNGKDSLLYSCRPTKPLPHSKQRRIPGTAAPNSVEAGLICA